MVYAINISLILTPLFLICKQSIAFKHILGVKAVKGSKKFF